MHTYVQLVSLLPRLICLKQYFVEFLAGKSNGHITKNDVIGPDGSYVSRISDETVNIRYTRSKCHAGW